MSFLLPAGGATVSASVATVTFIAAEVSTTNASVYTFSSVGLSTAAAGRQIVVMTSGHAATTTLTSVTVAGNATTSIVEQVQTSSNSIRVALVKVALATGTSGDIVVTWGASQHRCGIQVWAVYDASTTINDTLGAVGDVASGTINCDAGGLIVGGGFTSDNLALETHDWAGITKETGSDEIVEGENNHSSASDVFAAAQSGLTVSMDSTGWANVAAMVACSFSKA